MSNSASDKLKILLVGSVQGQIDLLASKLVSLQKSKAGPFDVCFCVGSFGSNVAEMPLPVYVQDYEYSGDMDTTTNTPQLAPNLYCLGNQATADIYSLDVKNHTLIVASCPANVRVDAELTKPLQTKTSHESYVGCDFLFTSEWPQGVDRVMSSSSSDDSSSYSFDVAELAMRARPRYHVSVSQRFLQSQPFSHLQSSTSTVAIRHSGRFLALAPVVTPQQLKQIGTKVGKFVHALGLKPLQESSWEELSSKEALLPCPYTDEAYEKDNVMARASENKNNNNNNIGFSEAQARRIMAEETTDTSSRWTTKRKHVQTTQDDSNSQDSTTLFLHGLHKDTRGVLQTGSVALLQAFAKFGIQKIRRPPSVNSYAFLEFASHEEAKTCLEELGGEITVGGIHLTIKWASSSSSHNKNDGGGQQQLQNKKRRLTEAEAQNSSTIYFRLPPKILSDEVESAMEDLRCLMQETLESALAQDGISEEERVTAETEPALQVKARRPAQVVVFGFLEFASHAAASMALATLTGSTDGGVMINDTGEQQQLLKNKTHLMGVALHWAHDAPAESNKDKEHGLKFQRRHFPPDSRTDCWFCLASPTCERHLVVSVHENCYIAMPKGPATEGHVLIVPVAHTSRGALVDEAAEMDLLKTKLQQHASEQNRDLFVFERAIQTKGGYHTHVQCIPVERGIGPKLQSTMVAMARSIPGFDLKEINSDLPLSSILTNDDDDDQEGGYFYAEVQLSDSIRKRFLYKAKPPTDKRKYVVPLQFGREVIATVLDKPDLAHWKACVVDVDEETEMTLSFRKSFEKNNE